MKIHITHKTGELQFKSKSMSSCKQIALTLTFELATAIQKDFCHLWSGGSDLFDLDRLYSI